MNSPAIHLLRLQVAPIFEKLNVIEEETDHAIGFVQISLHLYCVLRWFPRIQETNILRQQRLYHAQSQQLQIWLNNNSVLKIQQIYALTDCSRDSVWLICSSHMPDSLCTLMTICWRRSNLEMIRICIRIITFSKLIVLDQNKLQIVTRRYSE